MAIGLTVSGSSLGGVIFPIALKRLFDEVGFGWGVRIVAFIMLFCLIIANLLVKSRLPPPGWTPGRKILDFGAFKEPVYCLVVAAATFCYWGLFTAFTFLTQYAEAYGMDENLAFYLISIINAASIVGRILPGVLADRVGVFNVQIVFTLLLAVGILAYWLPSSNQAAIITFALYYGFASGGFISLFTVCCAMISPIKRIGGRYPCP
jgi:predicted MFS family arabinose efflux permease